MTRRSWIFLPAFCACRSQKGPNHAEVRLAYTSGAWNQLPMRLALALGYFEETGLRIIPEGLPSSSKVIEALLGNSAEVASGSTENLLQLAAEGRRLPGFVNQFSGPAFVLVVSPKAAKRIRTIADLRGSTIGISSPGSQTHLIANHLLASQGQSADSVSTVSIGAGATSIASIERGMVDSGFVNYAGYTYLKRKYTDLPALFDPASSEAYRYPSAVLCARAEWLSGNPDMARRMAKATVRALRYIHETPIGDIAKRLPDDLRSQDAAADLEALGNLAKLYSADGAFPAVGFETLRSVVATSVEKVRTAQIEAPDVYTNEFVKGAA